MATTEQPQVNGDVNGKVPSSVLRVYDIPVVKDSIIYADGLLRQYSLANAAYTRAEAIASTVYKKAGEPLQERLQPQIQQLDGLANQGLDFVQAKAPFIFEAKTEELVSKARAPADQAFSTAKSYQDHAYTTAKSYQDHAFSTAKSYQDLVSTRLHDTLVASRESLGGLQSKLGAAAAHVPRTSEEVQQATQHLYEQLEGLRAAVLKQSHELPSHVLSALQPYIEKLQKGAGDVKTELSKKDVPVHVKAQHIIGITREITAETLQEAIAVVKEYVHKNKGEIKADGEHAVETTEQFVEEHTPGDHSYAEAVKQ